MRAKLAFGINEVTRALEKGPLQVMILCRYVMAKAKYTVFSVRGHDTYGNNTRDVRPSKMLQHLAIMARTTGTPFLVLPQATQALGKAFGLQRVAALGIRKDGDLACIQGQGG